MGLFVGLATWILILGGGGMVIESCNDADFFGGLKFIYLYIHIIPCVVPGGRMLMFPIHGVL